MGRGGGGASPLPVRFFPNEENGLFFLFLGHGILDMFLNSLFPALIWHGLSLLGSDTQAGLLPAGQAHLNELCCALYILCSLTS